MHGNMCGIAVVSMLDTFLIQHLSCILNQVPCHDGPGTKPAQMGVFST